MEANEPEAKSPKTANDYLPGVARIINHIHDELAKTDLPLGGTPQITVHPHQDHAITEVSLTILYRTSPVSGIAPTNDESSDSPSNRVIS